MKNFLTTRSTERLKEGKRKVKFKYLGWIEVIILFLIGLTSVSVLYFTVPVFLTVIFLLIQIKKYVAYRINRPYPVVEKKEKLIKEI